MFPTHIREILWVLFIVKSAVMRLMIQNRNVHFVEPLLIGCIPIHQKKKVLHILLRSKALMPQMVIQKL